MDPTFDPSADPTAEPTVHPSADPTISPSNAPSSSPTFYPTQHDAYNFFVRFELVIDGLTDTDFVSIGDAVTDFVQSVAFMVESGFNNEELFSFKDIDVTVSSINGKSVEELAVLPNAAAELARHVRMDISSLVECDEAVCRIIALRYMEDSSQFEQFVTNELNARFRVGVAIDAQDAELLRFSVVSVSEAMELYPSADSTDTVLFVLLSVSGCFLIIGLAACVVNKMRCKNSRCSVDEARWISIVAFALQFWDFGLLLKLSSVLSIIKSLLLSERRDAEPRNMGTSRSVDQHAPICVCCGELAVCCGSVHHQSLWFVTRLFAFYSFAPLCRSGGAHQDHRERKRGGAHLVPDPSANLHGL